MRELIVKPEGSSPLKVFYREVRKDGRAYIDYYMTKENAAKPAL